LLDHQKRRIGTFTLQLLEAKNLVRHHWSLLSIGPVKHLGLSKAHGQVSSFVQFQLGFIDYDSFQKQQNSPYRHFVPSSTNPTYQSSTVYSNSNPSWSNTQSSSNKSLFSINLQKASLPQDGMNVVLQLMVKEERTAAETFLPGISGITKGGATDGQIGVAHVDLTNLLLRREETSSEGTSITPHVVSHGNSLDVWDLWIDLVYEEAMTTTMSGSAPYAVGSPMTTTASNATTKSSSSKPPSATAAQIDSKATSSSSSSTGQIRILISYEPHGLHPRQGDIVALESFARLRESSISCHPILPPLFPLQVLDIRGDYLLVQFDYISSSFGDESPSLKPKSKSESHATSRGMVKIHRNSIFVIERKNLVDAMVNVALTPIDVALSTPLGKEITHHTQPYVEAVGELLMPAFLSTKLLWEACKLGGGATLVGVQTAASVILQSQDPENRRRVQKK
jgi:hypothetical protein